MGVDGPGINPGLVPYGVAAIGLLTGLVTIVEIAVAATRATSGATITFVVGVVTSLPFSVALVAGAYWLSNSDVSAERYPRIGLWVLGGMALFVLMFGVVVTTLESFWAQIGTMRWGVAIGAGGGLLVGLFEARAIERAVAAERTAVRSEELERRRELLDYLNGLLRHEVLNTANVIEGYADHLADRIDETAPEQEHVSYIRQEARELTSITQDVRVLLDATEGIVELEPRDVTKIVREELTTLQNRFPEVETETDMPDAAYVEGDDMLRRIFSNLLTNAVEHNDSETPRVTVTVVPDDETVTVRIEDNGPGVPEARRDDLFDHTTRRGPDHGLGLSIVATLADRYGGDVELTRTGPDGSVFAVTLPRPSETPDDASRTTDRGSPRASQ